MAKDTQLSGELRDNDVKTVAGHIEDACQIQKQFGQSGNSGPLQWILTCGRPKGIYVTIIYLLVKLLYIANLIAQFFILNSFLGTNYRFWGAEILSDLTKDITWEETGHFPRVTLCDFKVRELGNIHHYTVQCVLMINMFNEKIFLFLWWWFFIVAILTCMNFLWWLLVTVIPSQRVNFVRKYLKVNDHLNMLMTKVDENKAEKFVRSKLRLDGVFVLRLISNNAGDLLVTQIVKNMWDNYTKTIKPYEPMIEQEKKPLNSQGV